MRYIVEYTYGPGSYGEREFDWNYSDTGGPWDKAKTQIPTGTRILNIKNIEGVKA